MGDYIHSTIVATGQGDEIKVAYQEVKKIVESFSPDYICLLSSLSEGFINDGHSFVFFPGNEKYDGEDHVFLVELREKVVKLLSDMDIDYVYVKFGLDLGKPALIVSSTHDYIFKEND